MAERNIFPKGAFSWVGLIASIPAALTVASQLLGSVEMFHFLVLVIERWRGLTRAVWDQLFSLIRPFVELPFVDRQYDALTLMGLAFGFTVMGVFRNSREPGGSLLAKNYGHKIFYPASVGLVFLPSLVALIIFSGLPPIEFVLDIWEQSLVFFTEAVTRLNALLVNDFTGGALVVAGFVAFFWVVADVIVYAETNKLSAIWTDAPKGIRAIANFSSWIAASVVVLASIYAFGAVSFGAPNSDQDFFLYLSLYFFLITALAISVARNWLIMFQAIFMLAIILAINWVVHFVTPLTANASPLALLGASL